MKPFTTKQIWLMVGIRLGFFLLYTAASATLLCLGTAWESTSLGHGAARHHGGLRHVPTVRPRHLPQPCHQPDSVIRVRSVPDYRLRRLRETALSPVVQPAEPAPAAIGGPADSGHPADELRDPHTARLHPPSTIRRHHRQAARTLV